MNTNQNPPRQDFKHLSKAQLVRRLEFAEYMMIYMRDAYLAQSLKPEPYPFARDRDRGFANAMEMALKYIITDPDERRATDTTA